MTQKKKIYFPNLNGLRFIAAFLVMVHHIEQIKSLLDLDSYWREIPFVGIIGKLGVVLFFVLSGFLITYLLLAEERSFKKISIKQFYMRRVLRIWPLYFLIVLLAFAVLPHIDLFVLPDYSVEVVYANLGWKLLLFAIFFPNLALSLFGPVPYASHTWSIGAEEQFYLVWPVLLNYVKRHRLLLMFGVMAFYLGIKFFLMSPFAVNVPHSAVILGYWNSFPIDCMAIGGVFSIVLFDKSSLLKFIFRRDLFYASVALVTVFMLKGVYVPYLHYEFYAVFFGIIIINLGANPRVGLSLENKLFNYLGKISYGLYMYHPIAIVLAIALGSQFALTSNWLLYPLALIFTIVLAGLSYTYIETFFLRYKTSYTKVPSGSADSDSETSAS